MTVINRIIRAGEGKTLRAAERLASRVNAFEPAISALSDEALRAKTDEFKARIAEGQSLDSLLPEAFAVVREASVRTLGMRHFDVQLIGGVALHRGTIAEMKTGEGKTLVATLAAYLHGLAGKGVHIVTVNDYLATRDAGTTGPLYAFLGLSVGVLHPEMSSQDRIAAYGADITFGTNTQFGFDYLRDHLVFSPDAQVQRGHAFAIVDEVDSILIDEARTPLIISGPDDADGTIYATYAALAAKMIRDIHYDVDEQKDTISLLEEGIDFAERELGVPNLYETDHAYRLIFIHNAVRAVALFTRDKDYVVEDGQVFIVDKNTGRTMHKRRYSDSLHQALEAKEGVEILSETRTMASTTLQSYFRMYDVLSGMTGTAATDAAEFNSVYGLQVVTVPTNNPVIRVDRSDVIFRNSRGKYAAITADIVERHAAGQPVLVGTSSVEKSEYLSAVLTKAGIAHDVLNAKQHARESAIVAEAGRFGAVTIATNMAGRGTDILLGGDPKHRAAEIFTGYGLADDTSEAAVAVAKDKARAEADALCADERAKVLAAGGLYVLGTERNEARRIDDQLRGRSGRQGDPGETRFFISLDDDMMRVFKGDKLAKVMTTLAVAEDAPIEIEMINRTIRSAQSEVEGLAYQQRKDLVTYDAVVERQRGLIYAERDRILTAHGEEILILWDGLAGETVSAIVAEFIPTQAEPAWDLDGLWAKLADLYPISLTTEEVIAEAGHVDGLTFDFLVEEITSDLLHAAANVASQRTGAERAELLRAAFLNAMDLFWREHLYEMDQLRKGIGLRSYAQRDPKVEYETEGFEYFNRMVTMAKDFTVRLFLAADIETFLAAQVNLDELDYSAAGEPGASADE